MYKIRDYRFSSFKSSTNLHHSNYAVLDGDPDIAIKYCPHLSFEDEFFTLQGLTHKQIPKAHDYGRDIMFKDEKVVLTQHFLVLDHLSNEDLVDYFKTKTTQNLTHQLGNIIECFLSICDPLDYLHSRNYIHCDIKPGHLLLDPDTNTAYLIDFELVIKKGGLIKGISKDYASPEYEDLLKILRNPPEDVPLEAIASNVALDDRVDIYSLGAIMYEIMTDKKWKDSHIPLRDLNKLIPPRVEEVVMATLEEDPANRIATVKELRHALERLL